MAERPAEDLESSVRGEISILLEERNMEFRTKAVEEALTPLIEQVRYSNVDTRPLIIYSLSIDNFNSQPCLRQWRQAITSPWQEGKAAQTLEADPTGRQGH